jgi:hypothetical protein
MKNKKFRLVLVLAIMIFCAIGLASGADVRQEATATPPAAPHEHLSGAWLDTFHNPAPGIEMGADIRWRYIYGWNIDTLNDDATGRDSKWHFTRNRMRWWTKYAVTEDIDFNMRLVWEFRTWDHPKRKNQQTDFDEIVFDRFNITMRNMFDMPLTGVIGRQDIILGKGWLVLDGTPLDGSRTIYLDAARFTYDWEEKDTKIDMIYIEQKAASDAWLKPINDRDRHITEQDERGVIVYITNNSIENTQLEGYYIYKNDNPINVTPKDEPTRDIWPAFGYTIWSRKAEIHTFGGAIDGKLDDNWSYRAEGALQSGRKSGQDLCAFGSKNDLIYKFNDEMDNSVKLGYEYLSGDDPSTSKNEAFDPLWGEWPQWSELYIYSYNLETMIAETTNLHRFGITHSFKPFKNVELNTSYHLLWADENTRKNNTPTAPGGLVWDNEGKCRGQLLTCWLKYSCCARFSAHLLVEYLAPGNYYSSASRDGAYFLRANVEYTF